MSKKKRIQISDELDAMLKNTASILECTEAGIIKNALLCYLSQTANIPLEILSGKIKKREGER